MIYFIHRSAQGGLAIPLDVEWSEEDGPVHQYPPSIGREVLYTVPAHATGYCWEWSDRGEPIIIQVDDNAPVYPRLVSLPSHVCEAKDAVKALKALRQKHHVAPSIGGRSYEVIVPLSSIQNITESEKAAACARMRRAHRLLDAWRSLGGDFDIYTSNGRAIGYVRFPSGSAVHCDASELLDGIENVLEAR